MTRNPPGTGRTPTRPLTHPRAYSVTWARAEAQALRDYAVLLERNPVRQAFYRRRAAMLEAEALALEGAA